MASPAPTERPSEELSGPVLVGPPRARLRLAIGAVVVMLLAGLGGVVVAGIASPRGGVITAPGTTPATPPEPLVVVVHVLGAVASPGLYRLAEGSRVVDAVAAAGGFVADAERGSLNLARHVTDAEQLVVPRIGEVSAASAPAPGLTADGRVNLNTADRDALETLPRVGPAMADRILEWRERNGGFQSPEDLMLVTGIGERTFDALRDLVAV